MKKIIGILFLAAIVLVVVLTKQLNVSNSNKVENNLEISNEKEEKKEMENIKLTWYGQACVKIDNNFETLVIDPYSNDIGYGTLELEANKVLVTHDHYDHNNIDAVKIEEYIGSTYEVKEIESFHDDKEGTLRGKNTIYSIKTKELNICHLGDLGCTLDENQIEEIGKVDVLFIPVGGVYTIDAKGAKEVINQLNPTLVIPMHYKTDIVNIDLNTVDEFLEIIEEDYEIEYSLENNITVNKETEKKVVVLDYK